jgi:hypothetical protein
MQTNAAPQHSPIKVQSQRDERTFTLSTLFLFVTLVSVCMGAIMAAPGIGIPLTVFAVMAFGRASQVSVYQQAAGRPLTIGHKVGAFVSSLLLAFLVFVAAIVAFAGALILVCTPFFATEARIVWPLLWGLIALTAGTFGFWLMRRRWTNQSNDSR